MVHMPAFAAGAALPARPGARAISAARAPRMAAAPLRVGILGASGYTGVELLRLLGSHARTEVKVLTSSERNAGKGMGEVFAQFAFGAGLDLPRLCVHEDVKDWGEVADVVFCCLPHATTQEIIKGLPLGEGGVRVVDLSADFRLRDVDVYKEWYGGEHAAKELQKEAVYGLSELNREAVKSARLVANPGCCTYTRSSQGRSARYSCLSCFFGTVALT